MSVPNGWCEQRLPVTNPDPTKLKQELDELLGVGGYKMLRKGAGRVVVVSPDGLSEKQLEIVSKAFSKPRQLSKANATSENPNSPSLAQQRSNLGPDGLSQPFKSSEQPSENPDTPSPTRDSAEPAPEPDPEIRPLQRKKTFKETAKDAYQNLQGIVRRLTGRLE